MCLNTGCGDNNCSGCGPWTTPKGDKGDKGDTGPQGPAGADGADGPQGLPGSQILYSNSLSVGTSAGVNTQDLFTFPIPANTLSVNNDIIEVEAALEKTGTALVFLPPSHVYELFLGAQLIGYASVSVNGGAKQVNFKAQIKRITATTQNVQYEKSVTDYQASINGANPGLDVLAKGKVPATADLTASNNIIVRVSRTSGNFALNEIVCTQLLIKHLKQ